MELFDLSRLNSNTFERLVRALAFKLMGPAGVVYASGPDGARDFTFEGEIKGYESRKWSGYVVLQAKFKENPTNSASDVTWLERQIAGELKKYKDRRKKLRRPDYYIVVSNISLSGSDGLSGKGKLRTGGLTKISTALASWKTEVGLQDFDIWAEAKIIDLLCAYPEVRQTYAAWVTAGDVLTSILSSLRLKNNDFGSMIRRGIKDGLRRDQHARLRDAGSVVDDPVRVSQVFIDLPIMRDTVTYSQSEDPSIQKMPETPAKLVAMLTERAKERLDPVSIDSYLSEKDGRAPVGNKILIMGGPGQGKSTASMFLAQLFRATLLVNDEKTSADPSVSSLVPEIIERAKFEGISSALIPRYPIWIALPRFADAISAAKEKDERPPSLLKYIVDEMSAACDCDVSRSDLREWMAIYPWLVILDGLDEVPPTGERGAVIQAIASLETEAVEQNADMLMIVTTRPQGYNNDLDKKVWEHWSLQDLPSERAVAYADALGSVRYPLDSARRSDILKAVHEATLKPATSRLMVSPLQVTIMYLIVDTGGSVPVARWNLFNEYFEILKKREKAKGSINQKVLEQNWSHLGPIHQRAGLVLQTDSEHVGGALSFLDAPRFKMMLREFLKSEGFSEKDLESRANQLSQLALQRLVLLCSREEGKIAFDVRSLQEFMAAAALTSGKEGDVENRLFHIAALSHWRHTFLIAASRCFADDQLHYLRSTIVALPRSLDAQIAHLIAQSGPLLSLEMFIDGIGSDHPKSRKLLAQHALDLLSLGTEEFDDRLPLIVDEQTEDLIAQLLIIEISNEGTGERYFSAWKMLLSLAKIFPEKFLVIAEKYFPTQPESVARCLVSCDHLPRRSWPLFRAKAMLGDLIAGFSNPGIQSHQEQLAA